MDCHSSDSPQIPNFTKISQVVLETKLSDEINNLEILFICTRFANNVHCKHISSWSLALGSYVDKSTIGNIILTFFLHLSVRLGHHQGAHINLYQFLLIISQVGIIPVDDPALPKHVGEVWNSRLFSTEYCRLCRSLHVTLDACSILWRRWIAATWHILYSVQCYGSFRTHLRFWIFYRH